MPRPQDVNPKNFQVDQIVYETNDFSIASGKWQDGRTHLAMRWNGEGEDAGYPKLFNNSVWFLLPRELARPILAAIVGEQGSNDEQILESLRNYINI